LTTLVCAGGRPSHFSTSAADVCWRRMRPWRTAMAASRRGRRRLAWRGAPSIAGFASFDRAATRSAAGSAVRGGGRKSAVVHQPDLPAALETLIEDAIRGDPCSPLRWVSRSLRHLVKALAAQGFQASQRVVANLLREQNYSCQASRKTREGGNHPDRDAQFAHINATVKAAIAAGEPAISVDTKKKEACWGLQEQRPRATPQGRSGAGPGTRLQDPGTRQGRAVTVSMTLPPIMAGQCRHRRRYRSIRR
jgi:hypothetical protein